MTGECKHTSIYMTYDNPGYHCMQCKSTDFSATERDHITYSDRDSYAVEYFSVSRHRELGIFGEYIRMEKKGVNQVPWKL